MRVAGLGFGLCMCFASGLLSLPAYHENHAKEVNQRTLKDAATIDRFHRRHTAIGPSPNAYFRVVVFNDKSFGPDPICKKFLGTLKN